MITIEDALYSLRPNAKWVLRGDVISWYDEVQVEPTEIELSTEVDRLQVEYISMSYSRARKAEYDRLNQFEMQFEDAIHNTTTWIDAINAIKQRFPK